MHKIFTMPFAQVYPHYVNKIERKGRSVKELHEVITWLTGFSEAALKKAHQKRNNV